MHLLLQVHRAASVAAVDADRVSAKVSRVENFLLFFYFENDKPLKTSQYVSTPVFLTFLWPQRDFVKTRGWGMFAG